MTVARWMTVNPYCAAIDDVLDRLAAAMQQGRFRHVPIVEGDGRLIGMVSERDLRQHHGYLDSTKVSAVLTQPAVAVSGEQAVEDVARIMLERQISALPVVDREQRVVGIVTTSDLLRALLDRAGGSAQAKPLRS